MNRRYTTSRALLLGLTLVMALPRDAGAVDWDDPVRIGGWVGSPVVLPLSSIANIRGGTRASIADSIHLTKLRSRILAEFPNAILSGTQTLTPEYLSTIDILWISSWHSGDQTGVAALGADEQAAIRAFVDAGGTVMIFGETPLNSLGGMANRHLSTARSFVATFDLTLRNHPAWTGSSTQPATLHDPERWPSTSGPFDVPPTGECKRGVVTKFPGVFDAVPAPATVIATLDSNAGPAFAYIPCGARGPGSGAVLISADSSMMQDDGAGLNEPLGHIPVQNIILNVIAYHGTCQEPDLCPLDEFKRDPGTCGCDDSDVDSDCDLLPDCVDHCPLDPAKDAPGQCGCGAPEDDSDDDGTPDCLDLCTSDPLKVEPGACGCGNTDLDSDGDGYPDCIDDCPSDHAKRTPGICGCGDNDEDSDDDGTPDCFDACPADPNKTEDGVCLCGHPDDDSDADYVLDCLDLCPFDPLKSEPGECGCHHSDDDGDADGVPDCSDQCPHDPFKSAFGICGCAVTDIDSDGDGTADCDDTCAADPAKTDPGICDCGITDIDSDGDGVADCVDACPDDPFKHQGIGICGCGVADGDVDQDGYADCEDQCPHDGAKVHPGVCGCGAADSDGDGDGVADCADGCPSDASKTEPGQCGCHRDETSCLDDDGDGVANDQDGCPATPPGRRVNASGCSGDEIVALLCQRELFKNHGAYVSCVAHQANALRQAGLITNEESSAMVVAAALSDVGKK